MERGTTQNIQRPYVQRSPLIQCTETVHYALKRWFGLLPSLLLADREITFTFCDRAFFIRRRQRH